jgi:hypothetical protein
MSTCKSHDGNHRTAILYYQTLVNHGILSQCIIRHFLEPFRRGAEVWISIEDRMERYGKRRLKIAVPSSGERAELSRLRE